MAGIVWGVCPPDHVLLHGFTQSGASWARAVARSHAGRYRALAPDLGGGAARRPELDRPERARAGRLALAGYSMGGRIALALALPRPEQVPRLVLGAASPGLADEEERAARRAADAALAGSDRGGGAEAFAREWAARPVRRPVGRGRRAAHDDRLRRPAAGPPRAARAGHRRHGAAVGSPARAAMPVTLVVGGARRKVPRDRGADGGADAAGRERRGIGRGPRGRARGAGGGRCRDRAHAPGGALNRWRSRGGASSLVPCSAPPAPRGVDVPRSPGSASGGCRGPSAGRPARSARRCRRLRLERDNTLHTPWARAAALEAERRRWRVPTASSLNRLRVVPTGAGSSRGSILWAP